MSNLINEFFDLNGPCPEKIPNCSQLRQEFVKEIESKQGAHCRRCEEMKVKVKYMEIAWNAFVDSLR